MAKTFWFLPNCYWKGRKKCKKQNFSFTELYRTKDRENYESFKFDHPGHEMRLTYRQHEKQNLHDIVTKLKKLSSECKFKTLRDSFFNYEYDCLYANYITLKDHFLPNWLFPKQYLLIMLSKKLVNIPTEFRVLETIDLHKISKHSNSRSQTSTQGAQII